MLFRSPSLPIHTHPSPSCPRPSSTPSLHLSIAYLHLSLSSPILSLPYPCTSPHLYPHISPPLPVSLSYPSLPPLLPLPSLSPMYLLSLLSSLPNLFLYIFSPSCSHSCSPSLLPSSSLLSLSPPVYSPSTLPSPSRCYLLLQMFPVAAVCGNTMVVKPSERDPGATMMLCELANEAGFPAGVVNVIHGAHAGKVSVSQTP